MTLVRLTINPYLPPQKAVLVRDSVSYCLAASGPCDLKKSKIKSKNLKTQLFIIAFPQSFSKIKYMVTSVCIQNYGVKKIIIIL